MPWRCPACQTPLEHHEFEPKPRFGTTYRCHVCRLELVVDAATEKLTVTPMPGEEPKPSGGPLKRNM